MYNLISPAIGDEGVTIVMPRCDCDEPPRASLATYCCGPVAPIDLLRIPAHRRNDQMRVAVKGNGEAMTEIDVKTNRVADIHAKEAVKEHRVPAE